MGARKACGEQARILEVARKVAVSGYESARDAEIVDLVERYEAMAAELRSRQRGRRAVHATESGTIFDAEIVSADDGDN